MDDGRLMVRHFHCSLCGGGGGLVQLCGERGKVVPLPTMATLRQSGQPGAMAFG